MRLIDADALKEKSYWECYSDPDDDYEYVLVTDLDRAPTIEAEPVRKAKWEDKYNDGDWHCTSCGAIVEKEEQTWHNWYYCYHCGAKMEVDDGQE